MVNAGAIAVTSLVPGDDPEAKWRFIRDGLSRFAARELRLDDAVYTSASGTNHRNQSLAQLLTSLGRLYADPAEAVDLYTRQSCLSAAGLCETSGDWLYDIGLPGKSGIGGGIVTVAPGKGGLGTFAPLLDEAGNSVKGQLAAAFLSRRLGLDLLGSSPAA
jgi:glutaminase